MADRESAELDMAPQLHPRRRMRLHQVILWISMGCAAHEGPRSPDCESPAPLTGDPDAGRFIVSVRDGVSIDVELDRLSAIYPLESARRIADFAFVAELDASVVASLRCEPTIKAIEQDGVGTGNTR